LADEVAIPNTQSTAKIRHPLGPIGLSIITLGIYGIYWWYAINREMADLGRGAGTDELGDNPVLSVLAVTIGALVLIPPFFSLWGTAKRIEKSQNRVLGSNNFSPVLAFVLALIPLVSLVVPFLMQSNLNQVWERGR
jgi:hypothetical protein